MNDSLSTRPTIVILADDLLASWLQENLSEEHYQVVYTFDDGVMDTCWATMHVDLLLGEVRYPLAERLQHIEQLWAACALPRPLVLLLGSPAPPLHRFDGLASWLPMPFQLDTVIHLVDSMLSQHPTRSDSALRASKIRELHPRG